ncbi:MAG TPA: homocysteine S-methyltransferase family protein [Candidatus Merdiplasma excrementigallinarum]|uniref:Homocysteine S-methyltransferase family protein n=1 Tax=Candidatus Merdiplasma excrementigallinarum TaxID=2840864 RepID=A0A9D1NZF8_9FIRM|nr:homocysteine S-methyltransferase family protein [Candidatus Merdiplasma excrementigallinarum]
MTREEFETLTGQGIVYLDGACGSNLYLAGMPRGICAEQWILEHEQVMMDLQRGYVEAGSQMIYAPTFGANRAALSLYGLEKQIREYNSRLVDLSRRAVGDRALVGGDLSPTGKVLTSQGGETEVDEVYEIYREQIACLAEEGVDFLVAETMLSVEETMIALDAAQSVCQLPVLCSLTLEADGNALYGGNGVEAVETLQDMGASAVGVNCSVGPDQLENVIRNMKRAARIPILAKPNAGLPLMDEQGNAHYSMGPREFALHMKKLVQAGASLIGGCCGTTPEYIKKTRLLLEGRLI